jgi:hypothetical protein
MEGEKRLVKLNDGSLNRIQKRYLLSNMYFERRRRREGRKGVD